MREQCRHLLAAFEKELVCPDLQPFLIIHRLAGADADQHILYLGILLGQIVHIVRGGQRNITFGGKGDQLRVHPLLLRNAMILQLQIEVPAKNLFISQRGPARFVIAPMQQMLRHLAPRQALRQMIPSACAARDSISMRGL